MTHEILHFFDAENFDKARKIRVIIAVLDMRLFFIIPMIKDGRRRE